MASDITMTRHDAVLDGPIRGGGHVTIDPPTQAKAKTQFSLTQMVLYGVVLYGTLDGKTKWHKLSPSEDPPYVLHFRV